MTRFLPVLLLLLPVLPAQAEIYKWVDESGHTHFGEKIPEKYRKSSTEVTPQKINTIQGAKLKGPTPRGNAPATTQADTPAPAASAPPRGNADTCQAQWEKFRESQACFQRFRLANGAVRPEATEKCESVPQPPLCQ